eukprot:TRINITY_DN12738_c0_g1_i1.p1 TRINITY_DN12738_c0_g1~~TRINITY_DN12738_c0_g1_i1.p1  ORF type:complete len:505 (-),score=151.09 TRINITY_DN12738_c0_g1_i1:65-1579(-)
MDGEDIIESTWKLVDDVLHDVHISSAFKSAVTFSTNPVLGELFGKSVNDGIYKRILQDSDAITPEVDYSDVAYADSTDIIPQLSRDIFSLRFDKTAIPIAYKLQACFSVGTDALYLDFHQFTPSAYTHSAENFEAYRAHILSELARFVVSAQYRAVVPLDDIAAVKLLTASRDTNVGLLAFVLKRPVQQFYVRTVRCGQAQKDVYQSRADWTPEHCASHSRVITIIGEPSELHSLLQFTLARSASLQRLYNHQQTSDAAVISIVPEEVDAEPVAAAVTVHPAVSVDQTLSDEAIATLLQHQVISTEEAAALRSHSVTAASLLHPCFLSCACTHSTADLSSLLSRVLSADELTALQRDSAQPQRAKRVKTTSADTVLSSLIRGLSSDAGYAFDGNEVLCFDAPVEDYTQSQPVFHNALSVPAEQRQQALRRVLTALVGAAEERMIVTLSQQMSQSHGGSAMSQSFLDEEISASQRSRFSHEEQADALLKRFTSNVSRQRSDAARA